MAYLNANIPVEYAQIRREYLYDLKKHHGEVEDCIIFGVTCITGRALLFHAIMENGAIFYRLPITAFIQRGFKVEDVPKRRLDELQLWNSFSYYPSVHSWDILESQAGKYIGKDKKWHYGKYLFTVDFAHPEPNILDTDHSEIPHEHKCAHILALNDGNYAAQPNNRLIWDIPSFTVKDQIPDWKVQTNYWNVEDTQQWRTEDTDNFFYEIEEKKHDKKIKEKIKKAWKWYIDWLFSWQKMNIVDLLKKNIVMVPVVASVLVGTFTGVKYIVNLTDTINANQIEIQELKTMEIENIRRDMAVLTDSVNTIIAKLERAEGTWEMAENLYEVLADKVRQMEYDIKDLNREINY